MQNEPTLSAVPGILLRAALHFVARLLVVAASVLLLAGAAIMFCSLLLGTWKSARGSKANLAAAVLVVAGDVARKYKPWKRVKADG